jgi:hypothetical protein
MEANLADMQNTLAVRTRSLAAATNALIHARQHNTSVSLSSIYSHS